MKCAILLIVLTVILTDTNSYDRNVLCGFTPPHKSDYIGQMKPKHHAKRNVIRSRRALKKRKQVRDVRPGDAAKKVQHVMNALDWYFVHIM
jgi:hypothetical protein